MLPDNAQKLPKSVKIVWLIHTSIAFVLILAVGLVINSFFLNHWQNILATIIQVIFVLVLLCLLAYALLIPYYYRFHQYVINPHSVSIYKSFFWRQSQTIPLNRIQNVDTVQGPILNIFKLQKLSIVTAANAFTINAIDEKTALQLRDQLIQAARQAREVDTDD